MSTLVEFIEYTKANYFYSLFTIFMYYFIFLILTLSVGMSAVKACIKEYFSWKATYERDIKNKE